MTYDEESKQLDLQLETYVKHIRTIVERIHVIHMNKKNERRNKRVKL
jgi:hypothetical protein